MFCRSRTHQYTRIIRQRNHLFYQQCLSDDNCHNNHWYTLIRLRATAWRTSVTVHNLPIVNAISFIDLCQMSLQECLWFHLKQCIWSIASSRSTNFQTTKNRWGGSLKMPLWWLFDIQLVWYRRLIDKNSKTNQRITLLYQIPILQFTKRPFHRYAGHDNTY